MTVRVRYAPSPTGEPHVGNIRSALFNWLYARHAGGSFIVRIEDTDQSRLVPGAMDAILDALSWLGLDWDEGPGRDGAYGPYVQSERLPLYQEHAERLVAEGKAYLCYCSEERIDQVRREKQAKGDRSGYDRRCRDPIEAEKAKAENPSPVVRFKTPLEGSSTVDDFVRGPVTFRRIAARRFRSVEVGRLPDVSPGERGGRPCDGDNARDASGGVAAERAAPPNALRGIGVRHAAPRSPADHPWA